MVVIYFNTWFKFMIVICSSMTLVHGSRISIIALDIHGDGISKACDYMAAGIWQIIFFITITL